jgi:hypothetical protein
MTSLGRSWALVALGLCIGAAGCDGGPDADAGTDGGLTDTGVFADAGSGTPCEVDEDCNDGVSCTNDSCGPTGFCRNAVDATLCDDGVFCNGVERCDPRRGCQPPQVRETCNDDDVCTIDRCDEATRSCIRTPRDLDFDGDSDWFCAGGGDCDDTNPAVSSLINEVCADGIDNDCDEGIDEATCGRPRYDVCEDPLDVSAGGFFLLNTSGAGADYSVSCAGGGRPDLVARFTLTEERSVEIVGEGPFFTVALALRTECRSAVSELACQSGFPGRLQRRSLPAGTYYVIASGSTTGEIGLTVRFGPPIPPPTNDACASPIDVSAGGTFTESFVEVSDDVTTSCGFGGSPDLVYVLTTTEERDVAVTAQTPTGESLAWALRSTCEAGTDLRCVYGGPAEGRVYRVPAGTYYLIVEGPTYVAPDVRVSVQLLEPTTPPVGDTCADPIALTLGATYTGTLIDKQDDLEVSCGFRYRDAVHRITLDAPSDLLVELTAGTFANVSVRPTCEGSFTELRCTSGGPARARLRNVAAGTYWIIAESWRPSGYTLRVEASPPTATVDVSGNEDCATAYMVPPTGGLFRGTTATLRNDYGTSMCGGSATSNDAAFVLTLTERRRVVLSTDGSAFDTVLHVHRGTCTTGAELHCDDDGGDGSTSVIDRVLDAGTWFVIVDGFGSSSFGEYLLEVTVTAP